MSAIALSGDVGLVALFLLTANLLLGLLISVRYSPWRFWPHKRINIFRLHNQTGFAALGACILHPILLLFSHHAGFDLLDVVFPACAPRQPTINLLGAIGLYTLVFVLVTSHYRVALGRRRWKTLHFSTYLLAGTAFLHGLLTDPHLNGTPFQPLDGEKLFVEACLLIVATAVWLRVRHARRKSRRTRRAVSPGNLDPLAEETTPEGTL